MLPRVPFGSVGSKDPILLQGVDIHRSWMGLGEPGSQDTLLNISLASSRCPEKIDKILYWVKGWRIFVAGMIHLASLIQLALVFVEVTQVVDLENY